MRKKIRVVPILALLIVSFFWVARSAFALRAPLLHDITVQNAAVTAEVTKGQTSLDSFVPRVFKGNLRALGCNVGPLGCLEDDGTGKLAPQANFIEGVTKAIAYVYEAKPAGTATYVADVLKDMRINIAQPAYAQGLGFSALSPILEVWKIFRNVAYFSFVIIFLVIGFMIMFRQQIGGQTVVTAQQAIPKIIIALLLVTFSYAIAGLMIDAMYLIMYLLAGLFDAPGLIQGNVFEVAGKLISDNTAGTAANNVASFVFQTLGQGVVGAIGGIISGLTIAVVVLLVIAFNAFRLFMALLRVYIEIILSIAFAPVILMMSALPGNKAFATWIKGLFFNLMVFPAILLLLIIFKRLADVSGDTSTFTGTGFLPPYLAGAASAGTIPFLAGLALILALPEAVDAIKKLGGSGGGPFGGLIQAGFKNMTRTADTAVPLSFAAAGAARGGVEAGQRIYKSRAGYTTPEGRPMVGRIAGDLFRGFDTKKLNPDGTPIRVGGITPRASSYFRTGQNVRRTAENVMTGKVLDANNIQQMLLNLERREATKKP